ncbi:hypothetical protein PG994_008876 [Apiospora phragmitis]|uniref:Uncharacterized protein n=1 Tax=Apiospora phragmitis TaxID=2905665 RepID=A0ABR1UKK6_9PEZI
MFLGLLLSRGLLSLIASHDEPARRGAVRMLRRSGRVEAGRESGTLAGLAFTGHGGKDCAGLLELVDLVLWAYALVLAVVAVVKISTEIAGCIALVLQMLLLIDGAGTPVLIPASDFFGCRRRLSEGVLSIVLAVDNETFPRPIADVREAIIEIGLVIRFIVALELCESRGQSGFIYLKVPEALRFVVGITFLGRVSPFLDWIGLRTPAIAPDDGIAISVVILRTILIFDEADKIANARGT